MGLFKVTKFEDGSVSDTACKELLSRKFINVKKNGRNKSIKNFVKSVDGGKIRKKKKIKVGIVKPDEVKNVLNKLKNEKNIDLKTDSSTKNVAVIKKSKNRKRKKDNVDNVSNDNAKNVKAISNENPQKTQKIKVNANNNTTIQKDEKRKRRREKKKLKRQLKKKTILQTENDYQNSNPENFLESINTENLDYKSKKREKIKQKLIQTIKPSDASISKKKPPIKSLRERMLEKLQAARFRYLNEQIYSSNSKEALELFSKDPESFDAYHEGYKQQVSKWPINPLDVIIKSVQKLPKTYVVADFGCGDARLATSLEHKVHSFDLVAKNDLVTACDMSHVPLAKNSVDVVVFCLSLMGTNLSDYLLEANRVLKEGGILKIAEVESRFEDINQFIEGLKRYHFKLTWKDLSHNLFYFLDFKKESNIKNKKKLPTISLNPCLYKKR